MTRIRHAAMLALLVLACGQGEHRSGDPTSPGSSSARVAWRYPTGAPVYYSTPAIAEDGTIYVGNGLHGAGVGTLFALTPAGALRWKLAIGRPLYSPTLGADGTIYIQDTTSTVYAISPAGTEKWRFPLAAATSLGQSSPALAADGTIYAAADGVYALKPDGSLRWKYQDARDPGAVIRTAPAVQRDGAIIVAVTREQYQPEVWALEPDGRLRWRTALSDSYYTFGSPSLGADGTIYLAAERTAQEAGSVYALSPAGAILWKYTADGRRVVRSSPAVAADGTIYVGTKATDAATDAEAELLALRPDGAVKWKYVVQRVHTTPDDIYCAPTIGADGTIYFGAESVKVYALDPAGTLLWSVDAGGNWTSPALAPDGTLYIGSNDNGGPLTAIHTDSRGLASAPWPRYHHDNAGSGRAR